MRLRRAILLHGMLRDVLGWPWQHHETESPFTVARRDMSSLAEANQGSSDAHEASLRDAVIG